MNPATDSGTEAVPAPTVSTVRVFDKKVMVVMPWLKHVSPITAFCAAQLLDKRRTASLLNFGDAFVAHSRNSCADVFLGTNLEWMLTIDDDMVIPFGNANWFNTYTGFAFPEPYASFNAIDRLMSHNKTLVGAMYFAKYQKGPPVFGEGMGSPADQAFSKKCPQNVIKPTRWVGTGCMLIHRSVYEDIEKRFPRLARGANKKGGQWFSSSEHHAMDTIDRARSILSSGPMTGELAMKAYEVLEAGSAIARANSTLGVGEDVQFCLRAKEAGHQPYLDCGLVCGHIGHKVFGPSNDFIK